MTTPGPGLVSVVVGGGAFVDKVVVAGTLLLLLLLLVPVVEPIVVVSPGITTVAWFVDVAAIEPEVDGGRIRVNNSSSSTLTGIFFERDDGKINVTTAFVWPLNTTQLDPLSI